VNNVVRVSGPQSYRGRDVRATLLKRVNNVVRASGPQSYRGRDLRPLCCGRLLHDQLFESGKGVVGIAVGSLKGFPRL
jgi:hypothetical protein